VPQVNAARSPKLWHLFSLALGLRIAFLAALLGAHPEIIDYPAVDGAFYDQWARDIIAGTGLAQQPFFAHPFYPHLLAAVYALLGPQPLIVALMQCVLGGLSAILLFRLVREHTDDRTALIAALGFALYWPFVIDDALLETVSLTNFLLLAAVATIAASGGDSWIRLFTGGILFGIACLCRGNLLLAAPILFIVSPPGIRGRIDARVVNWGIVLLGLLLVFFCVGLRNRIVAGQWLFTTGHSGVALYSGFTPGNFSGTYQAPPFVRPDPRFEQHDFHREAERRLGRKLASVEVSRYWGDLGLQEIKSSPAGALVRVINKLGLAIAAHELADNQNLSYLRSLTPFAYLPLPGHAIVVGLSVLGMGILWRKRRQLLLFYAGAALYLTSLLVFFVSSRLRAPLVVFLMPFAATTIINITTCLRARNYRRSLLLSLGVVSIVFAAFWIVPTDMKRRDWGQALSSHSLALLKSGNIEGAQTLQMRALTIEPQNPYLLMNAGLTASRLGRHHEARTLCERAAARAATIPGPHLCLGVALAETGENAQAEREFRRAMSLEDSDGNAQFNLAVLLAKIGRLAEANLLLQGLIERIPQHRQARQAIQMLASPR